MEYAQFLSTTQLILPVCPKKVNGNELHTSLWLACSSTCRILLVFGVRWPTQQPNRFLHNPPSDRCPSEWLQIVPWNTTIHLEVYTRFVVDICTFFLVNSFWNPQENSWFTSPPRLRWPTCHCKGTLWGEQKWADPMDNIISSTGEKKTWIPSRYPKIQRPDKQFMKWLESSKFNRKIFAFAGQGMPQNT